MEVRSVVQKEDRSAAQMEGPRAGHSVVLRVDRMEARWVAPMEVPREDRKVVRMEAPRVDCSEVQKVGRSGARMEVLRVARSEDRTGERLEGSGRMAEPVEVLLRLQVGVVEVRWRFPLRVQVGPRAVLPEPRARALPPWKEAVRVGGQRQGLPRVQEEWPRLAPVLGKEEDRSRR